MMRFILIFFMIGSVSGQTLKNTVKFSGFFDFHYQPSTDQIFFDVDKLDYEFLYVPSLSSGIGSNDIGLDRGQLGRERIVKFIKRGNKLLLIEPNLYYRSSSNNQNEIKTIEQAFAKSILYGFDIVSEVNNVYTIDFTPFLMEDRHGVSERLKEPVREIILSINQVVLLNYQIPGVFLIMLNLNHYSHSQVKLREIGYVV